jgi:hypothetical protein
LAASSSDIFLFVMRSATCSNLLPQSSDERPAPALSSHLSDDLVSVYGGSRAGDLLRSLVARRIRRQFDRTSLISF